MEGANRVYHGSWANSELTCQVGGFCWRIRSRTSGETERGFGKKARSPANVAATQAKVSMTSILFYVVCKVVCFCSQEFVP